MKIKFYILLLLFFLLLFSTICCRHAEREGIKTPLQAKADSLAYSLVEEYELADRLQIFVADSLGNIVVDSKAVCQNYGRLEGECYTLGPLMLPVLLATFDSLDFDRLLPVGCDSVGTRFVVDEGAVIDNDTGMTLDSLPVCEALAAGSRVAFTRLCDEIYNDRRVLWNRLKEMLPEIEWPSNINDDTFVDVCSGEVEMPLRSILFLMFKIKTNELADSLLRCAYAKNGVGSEIVGMTSIRVLEKRNKVIVLYAGYTNDYVFAIVAYDSKIHPYYYIDLTKVLFKAE